MLHNNVLVKLWVSVRPRPVSAWLELEGEDPVMQEVGFF